MAENALAPSPVNAFVSPTTMVGEENFAERLVGNAIRLYSRNADRAAMPTNRRVFLDSVVDRRKDPITESSFTPAELTELSKVVSNKYSALHEPVSQYAAYLQKELASHAAAVKVKNFDKILYPEYVNQYQKDLGAITAFKAGKLTQDFLDLARGEYTFARYRAMRNASKGQEDLSAAFNVKPNVQYEDYIPDSIVEPRTIFSSSPSSMLQTTLGRFKYAVDPKTGNLVITDTYDFNPRQRLGIAPTPAQPLTEDDLAEPLGGGAYALIRQWAGRQMPPGTGRPVRVETNALAPPTQNHLAK